MSNRVAGDLLEQETVTTENVRTYALKMIVGIEFVKSDSGLFEAALYHPDVLGPITFIFFEPLFSSYSKLERTFFFFKKHFANFLTLTYDLRRLLFKVLFQSPERKKLVLFKNILTSPFDLSGIPTTAASTMLLEPNSLRI